MSKFFLNIALFLLLLPANACLAAKSECVDCELLMSLSKSYATEGQKTKPDFNSLQLKASQIVLDMAKKSKRLDMSQIKSFVEVLRVAVPVDPGRSIIENTVQVIKDNKKDLVAEVKKLPKAESAEILEAIEVSILSQTRPNDRR